MDREESRTDRDENPEDQKLAQLERLVAYDGPDRMVPWEEYLADRENLKSKTVSFASGYAELDSLMENFETGELITVSGNTAMGKTLFLKSICRMFALAKVPISVFSFEDPTSKFLEPFKQLPVCKGIYVPQELNTGSLAWIEEKTIEAKMKYDNKIVFIDHLHYVVDMNLNKNFSLNVGAAMRFLKSKIAIAQNQIVFLVCHQEKLGDDQEPSLHTIRDSSFIGQESDMVFIVHRTPDEVFKVTQEGARTKMKKLSSSELTFDRGYTTVKIEKARRSGVHRKSISFVKKGLWLEAL